MYFVLPHSFLGIFVKSVLTFYNLSGEGLNKLHHKNQAEDKKHEHLKSK